MMNVQHYYENLSITRKINTLVETHPFDENSFNIYRSGKNASFHQSDGNSSLCYFVVDMWNVNRYV